MLHSSRIIIQQFKEVEEAMAQFKGVAGGKLNVAVISAGDYFFPRLLVEFARRHAGVTLNFGVLQPRGAARPAGRQPDRPGHHGAAAAGRWTR